jgi:hypothetical protein
MMTCGGCQRNLDEVPIGTPCPSCGSGRRDAVATPATVRAVAYVGQAVELNIASAIHAHTSDEVALTEVLAPKTFTAVVYPPTPGDPDSMWAGGLESNAGFTVSTDPDDVALGIAEAIRDELDP